MLSGIFGGQQQGQTQQSALTSLAQLISGQSHQPYTVPVNADTAAANTGITMQPDQTKSSVPQMAIQQAFQQFIKDQSFDANGLPVSTDLTKTMNSLNYPNNGMPDVQPPRYNGFPKNSYYRDHPDEQVDRQFLGIGI